VREQEGPEATLGATRVKPGIGATTVTNQDKDTA
jgi:hypothetical protein